METLCTRALAALVLAITLAACMHSPRNGQVLKAKSDRVSFAGYHPQKGVKVHLSAYNYTAQRWDEFATTTTSTVADKDDIGTDWYSWSSLRQIPQHRDYWPVFFGQRALVATVRATLDNTKALATFDVSADACLKQYRAQGGATMIDKCKSSQSPHVTVFAPCGGAGQACCPGAPCDSGYGCSPTSDRCETCGGDGQVCCAGSTCGGNLYCDSSSRCAQVASTSQPIVTSETPCTFKKTETECYAVSLWCRDVRTCGIDGSNMTEILKKGSWYACGVCAKFPPDIPDFIEEWF